MEKILPSILAALIPFIATYLSKLNKASVRKNLMEDAQKKIDFLDKYFQVSSKFLHETEIESLKLQLSAEIQEVKSQISSSEKQENLTDYQRLTVVQKVFLTFSPVSVVGWLLSVLFYIILVFSVFLFWGFSLDEASNFSTETFVQSVQDGTSIFVFGFLMIILLLFRWLAIKEYKRKTNGIKQ
ncbi:MAG TPA: hypothetical protein DHV48_12205 [Prolixibacteraceae bacterium]|nr:hypothetical protein [Prolixibacteraceae bacterium]